MHEQHKLLNEAMLAVLFGCCCCYASNFSCVLIVCHFGTALAIKAQNSYLLIYLQRCLGLNSEGSGNV